MSYKEVTIFGATGIVGGLILKILTSDEYFNKINVVYRNSI
jgi:aspartate-semialdehyde dehydrogenase